MGLIILAVLAFVGWMMLSGKRPSPRAGAAMATGLLGAVVLLKGRPIIGGLMLGAAALIGGLIRSPAPRPLPGPAPDLANALDLLGLDASADEEAVRAAHRRLIARNHPDAGGSAGLARNINAARDVVLRHLARTAPNHHPPSNDGETP
jgi:hypothetical protein